MNYQFSFELPGKAGYRQDFATAKEIRDLSTNYWADKENVEPSSGYASTDIDSPLVQDLTKLQNGSPMRSSVLHDFKSRCDYGIDSPALAFMNRPPCEALTVSGNWNVLPTPDVSGTSVTSVLQSETGTKLSETIDPPPYARAADADLCYTNDTCKCTGKSDTAKDIDPTHRSNQNQSPSADTSAINEDTDTPHQCNHSSALSAGTCTEDTDSCCVDIGAPEPQPIEPEPPDFDTQSTKALLDMSKTSSAVSCKATTCVPTHAVTFPLYSEIKGAPRCYVIVPMFKKKLTNQQLVKLAAMMGLGFLLVAVILIWVLSPMLF